MDARCLLGIALATATAVGACGGADDGMLIGGSGSRGGGSNEELPGDSPGEAPGTTESGEAGSAPTNSPEGKKFYAANVHTFLQQKCASCHQPGGAGSPTWIDGADAEKSYVMIYANGYAVPNSRIVVKGVHSAGAGPELLAAEKAKFDEWLAIEMADGKDKAQVNVLEKLGDCFDEELFRAIGLQDLRTTRRQSGNNPNNYNENANTCTGCNQAPCMTCHSGDDATNFVLSLGNPNLPATYTFEESKKTNPAYIQKYFATSPTGEPEGSLGLRKKADATRLDRPYTHPMYRIGDNMQGRIDTFVNDAITRYKNKQCGQ
jgi:hypothetical protein